MRRPLLLLMLVAGAALATALPRIFDDPPREARLTWVATAQQHGPVGYRDPAGAISPDGRWIAYSEGRLLRVRSIDGGPVLDLPPGDGQIRRVAWHRDGRTLFSDGVEGGGWARYDTTERSRVVLPGQQPPFTEAACVDTSTGARRLTVPCGGPAIALDDGIQPYGPVALSPDGTIVYFAAPNAGGTVDLWSVPATGGRGGSRRSRATRTRQASPRTAP